MKKFLLVLGVVFVSSAFAADQSTPPHPPVAAPARKAAVEEEKPVGSKADQLVAAQKQLAILKLRHDEKHPVVQKQRAKVVRLQKEAQADEKQKGTPSKAQQLAAAKEELAELSKKFTDLHPRVVALKRQIAELEQGS